MRAGSPLEADLLDCLRDAAEGSESNRFGELCVEARQPDILERRPAELRDLVEFPHLPDDVIVKEGFDAVFQDVGPDRSQKEGHLGFCRKVGGAKTITGRLNFSVVTKDARRPLDFSGG